MNKIFTKEQISKLKEFERDFHTVLELKYKRNNTRADLNVMADIYEECTGIKLNRDYGCSNCQYTLVGKVGQLYRKSVAYWAEEDEKAETEKQEIAKDDKTVQEIKADKPRRAYKKKEDVK